MNWPQDTDLIERRYLLNEAGRSHKLQTEMEKWKARTQIGLVVAGVFLLSKFEGNEVQISYGNHDVMLHSWSWWGVRRWETLLTWRENQWMAQDEKGEWYVAIEEEPDYDPPEPGP